MLSICSQYTVNESVHSLCKAPHCTALTQHYAALHLHLYGTYTAPTRHLRSTAPIQHCTYTERYRHSTNTAQHCTWGSVPLQSAEELQHGNSGSLLHATRHLPPTGRGATTAEVHLKKQFRFSTASVFQRAPLSAQLPRPPASAAVLQWFCGKQLDLTGAPIDAGALS